MGLKLHRLPNYTKESKVVQAEAKAVGRVKVVKEENSMITKITKEKTGKEMTGRAATEEKETRKITGKKERQKSKKTAKFISKP
jgi:hypothetical protein